MFNILMPVEILGENSKLPVVSRRLRVGIYGLTHSHKKHDNSYTPPYTQLNQKLIPLLIAKFTSVNFCLYTLSTGPIVTTTYINTKED
jgi:hypothetical protein